MKTRKIVINGCFGGFGLSDAAKKELALRGISDTWNIPRDNPHLVEIVEKLGTDANKRFASLGIVEIPDDVEWEISDYDGVETIHEKHRSWS